MTEIVHDNQVYLDSKQIAEALKTKQSNQAPRMGVEYETIFHNDDAVLSIMRPEQSQAILKQILPNSAKASFEDSNGKLYNKKPPENSIITSLTHGKTDLSLELSGVLELATAPFLIGQEKELLNELKAQRDNLNGLAKDQNLIPCPFSSSPHVSLKDVENNSVERQRLKAGFQFFKNQNSRDGMASMGLITSTQVSIEANHERFDEQVRCAFMIQPLFFALFSSHSGYLENKSRAKLVRPDVYLSYSKIGKQAERSGIPSFIFNYDTPVLESYANAVLNTPMLFHYGKNDEITQSQPTFAQLQEKTPDLATKTNLNAARSLLFYDVKIHQTNSGSGQRLELRSPDSGPGHDGMALLLASACLGTSERLSDTKQALLDIGLFKDPVLDKENVQKARRNVSNSQLQTRFGRKDLQHFAATVLEIVDGQFQHSGLEKPLSDLHFVIGTGLTNTQYAQNFLKSKRDVIKTMRSPTAYAEAPLAKPSCI